MTKGYYIKVRVEKEEVYYVEAPSMIEAERRVSLQDEVTEVCTVSTKRPKGYKEESVKYLG